ncbi:Rieske 2Fe-2S domain-containing protein [Breoghania sp.]|uniref:Rieske (2Fe-2S) protein n=1 Tax=Breoghania sp. TaxID=2065378 RepID=UPI00260B5D21|nr:Rieske 2Fe-2S domain-containing protein [Breoghania sp.]MDJ0931308.1 Rieske 2Fe-2S domain-containing protein [Breoghania sp.]
MNTDVDLYVVCGVDDIARGSAKAFSLSRLNEEGESRPFPVVIVRTDADTFVGYANICPHNRLWLNIGDGAFFNDDGSLLKCGCHGVRFEILSGQCIEGPCAGSRLEPVPLLLSEGEVCIYGIRLAEDSPFPDPFSDYADTDETMEIMIHPD